MRLLLDTHVWLWSSMDTSRIGEGARAALLDPANELLVSAASVWELAIKVELGKLALPAPVADFVAQQTGPGVATLLDITAGHAMVAAALPRHHRDPFDRMLVAQTQLENLTLVTVDEALEAYGVPMLSAT